MKANNLTQTPDKLGFIALPTDFNAKYIIGPSEDFNKKKGNLEKKFLSEWFGGTYMIGDSTDPYQPSFKSAKFTFEIKGNKTTLGLGAVYGAVKYDNQWRAGRIIKAV